MNKFINAPLTYDLISKTIEIITCSQSSYKMLKYGKYATRNEKIPTV